MSTDDTITAWGNHVDGAVALTKAARHRSVQRSLSRYAIFRAVRTMMVRAPWLCLLSPVANWLQITSCVQRSKPVDDFPGTKGWVGHGDISEENAANRLTLDLHRLAQSSGAGEPAHDNPLRCLTRDWRPSESWTLHSWSTRISKTGIGLCPQSGSIESLESSMRRCRPEDIALAEKWPGEQHVYHDVPLASIMNDYRVCRIFCPRSHHGMCHVARLLVSYVDVDGAYDHVRLRHSANGGRD